MDGVPVGAAGSLWLAQVTNENWWVLKLSVTTYHKPMEDLTSFHPTNHPPLGLLKDTMNECRLALAIALPCLFLSFKRHKVHSRTQG
jgi:hypothetical protein